MNNNIETLRRTCPTCEASCGLALEVDPGTKQVLSIKGDPDDVRSRGYVCAKSQAFRYVFEDPERLRRPVKKVGDDWQEISWEEALEEVASRLSAVRARWRKVEATPGPMFTPVSNNSAAIIGALSATASCSSKQLSTSNGPIR